MPGRRRKWLIVITAVLGVLGVLVGGSYLTAGPDLAFDRAAWRVLEDPVGPLGSQPHGYNRRARMAADLIQHHLRPGMRWGEASALLGQRAWGGEGEYCYLLVWDPRLDQKCACLIRWGTTDPLLKVTIDRTDGSEDARVVAAKVTRH